MQARVEGKSKSGYHDEKKRQCNKSAKGNNRFDDNAARVKEVDGLAAVEEYKDKACNWRQQKQSRLWRQRQRDSKPGKSNQNNSCKIADRHCAALAREQTARNL